MGRFGIPLADYEMKPPEPLARGNFTMDPGPGDGPVDRSIAWVSYFVMVFVAICAFMPARAALAYQEIRALVEPAGESPRGVTRPDDAGTISRHWVIRT